MVQTSVDNTPVSIALAATESTSVPTGETWVITVSLSDASSGEINGGELGSSNQSNPESFETTVSGGDTISCTGGNGLHIGGFKV